MTSFAFARLRATKQSAAQMCWAGILLFQINLYLAIVKVALLPLWLMSNIVVSYPIMNQSSKITCNVMYTDASSLITQMFKIVFIAAQHLGLWYFFDGDKKMMMFIDYYQVLDLGGNNLQILPREVFSRHGLLNLQKLKVGLFVLRYFLLLIWTVKFQGINDNSYHLCKYRQNPDLFSTPFSFNSSFTFLSCFPVWFYLRWFL